MDPMVQVEGLRKVYGATVAVDDVSFGVEPGKIFGMLGPNGAGKTTTIECLEGLRKPDAGRVRVLGVDPQRDGQTLRLRCGMQLQQSNLPDRMQVWEALDLYSAFYPKAVDWKVLLAQLGLEEKRSTPFAKLSGGQKQRLSIARALVRKPEIYIFDDCFSALDFKTDARLRTGLKKEIGNSTVIMVAQRVSSVMDADRIIVLDDGRIVGIGKHKELLSGCGVYREIVASQLSEEEIS